MMMMVMMVVLTILDDLPRFSEMLTDTWTDIRTDRSSYRDEDDVNDDRKDVDDEDDDDDDKGLMNLAAFVSAEKR